MEQRRVGGFGKVRITHHDVFVFTAGHHERFAKRFAITPEKGAETLVYLASSPEVAGVTGEYFYKCRPATPNEEAQDDAKAKRLWKETVAVARVSN